MSTSRPMLTQREAADACGVSRTTIRRRREAGELPGSVLDDERGWLIPVDDLLAAGFRLHAPAPPDQVAPGAATATAAGGAQADQTREAAELRAELERQRHEHERELAEERHARALAEAEARHLAERLQERAAHISDLQRALAALTPAPDRAAIPQPTAPAASVPAPSRPPAAPGEHSYGQEQGQGERRRWWPRRG
ncbi:helix-turn-helix domain-containing protein [Streptomyces longwoodensis]|uniref:helix-turn-helix domain-containing protein n=1 Tax=Streptomyces longwoodensis TaxID=68231 RepID=UPI0030E317D0|nr:helix-turn-helix domain-containing protein [Streptomyces longwoodensis]